MMFAAWVRVLRIGFPDLLKVAFFNSGIAWRGIAWHADESSKALR